MLKNSEFQVQFEFKDSKFLDATITLHELYNENSRRNYSMGNTNIYLPATMATKTSWLGDQGATMAARRRPNVWPFSRGKQYGHVELQTRRTFRRTRSRV